MSNESKKPSSNTPKPARPHGYSAPSKKAAGPHPKPAHKQAGGPVNKPGEQPQEKQQNSRQSANNDEQSSSGVGSAIGSTLARGGAGAIAHGLSGVNNASANIADSINNDMASVGGAGGANGAMSSANDFEQAISNAASDSLKDMGNMASMAKNMAGGMPSMSEGMGGLKDAPKGGEGGSGSDKAEGEANGSAEEKGNQALDDAKSKEGAAGGDKGEGGDALNSLKNPNSSAGKLSQAGGASGNMGGGAIDGEDINDAKNAISAAKNLDGKGFDKSASKLVTSGVATYLGGSGAKAALRATGADKAISKGIEPIIRWLRRLATFMAAMQAAIMASMAAAFGFVASTIASLLQAALGWVATIVNAITSTFWAAVGAIGNFFGSIWAGVTTVVTTVAVATTSVVVGVGAYQENKNAQDELRRVGSIISCDAAFGDKASFGKKSDEEIVDSEEREKNLRLIYNVLSGLGGSDGAIAAILGNWTVESSVDPASVEGFYGTYGISDEKKDAIKNKQAYWNQLKARYAKSGVKINEKGYMVNGVPYVGIGLGQWTGPRGKMLLDFADKAGSDWYGLDTNLAFLLGPDSRSAYLREFLTKEGSPEDLALDFLQNWEGINNGTGGKRAEAAKNYYAKFDTYAEEADEDEVQEMVDNIKEMADVKLDDADSKSIQKAIDNCVRLGGGSYNNSDMVKAILSYAWHKQDIGWTNDGTDLWLWAAANINHDTTYLRSCDRTVAAAVRWSGTDDDFPLGPTNTQWTYLNDHSDSWDRDDDWTADTLKPGDILITRGNGHVLMYVGKEGKKAFPNESCKGDHFIVSGSYGQRSPGLGCLYEKNNKYARFRFVGEKTKDSKYKKLKPPAGVHGDPEYKG